MRIFTAPLTRKEKRERRKAKRLSSSRARMLSDAFLTSREWRTVRIEIIKRDGRRCACCGATPDDGVQIHVDHIKNRRDYPHLALDKGNLQVLCEICNHGKGNWDSTDWRKHEASNEQTIELEQQAHAHLQAIK